MQDVGRDGRGHNEEKRRLNKLQKHRLTSVQYKKRHDIAQILLKLASNINLMSDSVQDFFCVCLCVYFSLDAGDV